MSTVSAPFELYRTASEVSVPVEREPLILIVDDIPRNLQVLGSILSESGYSVSVASSGQGALDAIGAQIPDLILLDVQMPDIDGLDVCRRLKAEKKTADIPIIFLTARIEAEDIVQGFEAGAVDYITKPFVATELLARVRTHLRVKQYHDLIASQNQHLQALNAEKSELLSVVAHDLKSPLTNVQLLADILDRKSETLTPERIREYADDLRQSSDRMLALINNILNIHSIETGNFTLAIDRTSVNYVIEQIVSEYRLQAQKKSIAIEYAAVNANLAVYADPMAFAQIVANLVSNAIKYSPPQTIVSLSVQMVKHQGSNASSGDGVSMVQVAVRDEGPGLSDDDQQRLFTKFARLSSKPTGGESSTGLGLSIVKRLALAMGGDVFCQSALGQGSTFSVVLPYADENDA